MKIGKYGIITMGFVVLLLLAGASYSSFLIGEKAGIESSEGDGMDKGRAEGGASLIKGFENSSLTALDSLYWLEVTYPNAIVDSATQRTEYRKYFGTNDITRSQQNVPFTIVLPRYIPPSNQHLPAIQGPISPSSDNRTEIRITYGVLPSGIIIIHEYTYPHAPASPVYDPTLERIEITGKQVFRDRNNTLFKFQSEDVDFIVQSRDVPGEEVKKVAESMIQQIQ